MSNKSCLLRKLIRESRYLIASHLWCLQVFIWGVNIEIIGETYLLFRKRQCKVDEESLI